MLHDAGKGWPAFFGDLAVFGAPAEGLKAQQRGGGGGIAGRRGRILQGLAARRQRAQRRRSLSWRGSIEESAGGAVVEARDHGVGQLDGGVVILHFAAARSTRRCRREP